jgi:hypothetical protein
MFDDLFEIEDEEMTSESYATNDEQWDTEQIWYSTNPDNVWSTE